MPKSKIQQYQQFQEYTNYIDTSDVMLGFYKNEEANGLQKYFLMIEEWLSMDPENPIDNHPLVIEGDGGVGKKTLLVKWYEYHQSLKPKNKKDLMILHFGTTGGNNSNYFYAIYRILIKLRQELNIGQKVQLHQEKIRKYFSYWLDVCNQRIQDQSFQDLETIYEKIILVFQGIDYFIDRGSGKEGNIAFWLPKYFPKNVKVIVTADGESESMKYFNKLGCHKVQIPSDASLNRNMMKSQSQKQLCVSGDVKNRLFQTLQTILKKTYVTSLFVKSYLSCLIPEKIIEFELSDESINFIQKQTEHIKCAELKELNTTQELFQFLLEFWGKNLFQKNQEKFKEILGILVHTQKGLTRSEIVSITNITPEQLKVFITLFRTFLMNFKDLWMIKNDCFKKVINAKYQFNICELSEKIAEALKKTPNSVRKLQEETFQLYTAGNYFRLKQVISDIENFLLLFNPYTKYDLCKYWQKLEEKSFDPVIEYNKAIQGFQMHYHPTPDDLFRIITQISRFLKEFSDFETYYTPEFRHPEIVGNKKQLEDIGILGELKNLQMCEWQQEKDSKIIEEQTKKQLMAINGNSNGDGAQKGEVKLKQKIKEVYEKIDHIGKSRRNQSQNCSESMVSENERKLRKNKRKQNSVHQLNVEVKSNQEAFRNHYYEEIKPFLEKVALDGDKEITLSDNDEEEDYEDSDKEDKDSGNLVAKIKSIEREKQKQKGKIEELPNIKSLYAKTVEQQFQLNQKPPTNYYYRRWIWMQFPWVCMAMKCDYSDKLRKCFTSPTSYMSVSEQRQFTLQALKIALEAKKKKQAILEKTQQNIPNKKKKQVTLGPLTDTAKSNSRNDVRFEDSGITYKSKAKNRLQQLGFVTNSFLSLKNLEKEMNEVNKNLAQETLKQSKSKQKLGVSKTKKITEGNSLFLTSEEKTYEEYSSLLHSMNKKKKKQLFAEEDLNLTTNSVRNKSMNTSKEGLLPRIKQNINREMISELEQLEKNNSNMRKEVDSYQYKNKVLAKRLKQLKIIQFNNTNKLNNQKKLHELKEKIREYQAKIEKVKYQYAFSILEHERLNVLIKICQQNKTQNQQCIPDLIFECNNLKKMIAMEKSQIQQLYKKIEEIKKITKKFLKNCYEKVKNEAILNEEIQTTLKNREVFHGEVEKYDEMILEEIQGKRKELNDIAREIHDESNNQNYEELNNASNIMSPGSPQKIRKSFNISQASPQKEENYEEVFNRILEYLGVEEDPENPINYENSQKYIQLINGLNKKKELETIISERKLELEELNKRCNEEKRLLEIFVLAEAHENQKVNGNKSDSPTSEDNEPGSQLTVSPGNAESEQFLMKQLHEKQRNLKKLTDVKLSCLGMLNTWCHQLGIQQQQQLTIPSEMIQQLRQAKALGSQSSQKITC